MLLVVLALLVVPVVALAQVSEAQIAEEKRLFQIGQQALGRKDYRTALSAFEAGLRTAQAGNNALGAGSFLDGIGSVYGEAGEHESAIRAYQQALQVKLAVAKPDSIARTYSNMGVTFIKTGKLDEAIEAYSRSLALWERAGDPGGIATVCSDLSGAMSKDGRWNQAVQLGQRALALRERTGDRGGIADSLNNLGLLLVDVSRSGEATPYFVRALQIKEALGDRSGVASTLNNLGSIAQIEGDYPKALEYQRRSLALKLALGEKASAAGTLSNIGITLLKLGRYDAATRNFSQSLDMYQQLREPGRVAGAHNNLGTAYLDLGQYRKAVDHLVRGLEVVADARDTKATGQLLRNLADALLRLGEPQVALKALSEANTNAPIRNGVRYLSHVTLILEGRAYLALGQPQKAIEKHKQVLSIVEPSNKAEEIADALVDLAIDYRAFNQREASLDYLNRAVKLRAGQGNALSLAVTQTWLARVLAEMGQADRAAQAFAAGVAACESVAEQVGDSSAVGALQENTLNGLYAGYARLLHQQGKVDEALLMVERGRGQGLARQAGQNREEFSGRLPRADATKLKTARTELRSARAIWRKLEDLEALTDSTERSQIRQQILQARGRYQNAETRWSSLREELMTRYPEFRRRMGATPATMPEIKALAAKNPDTLYLEWSVLDDGPTLLFTLSHADGLKAFQLPSTGRELAAKLTAWREELIDGEQPAVEETRARELFALLLGQVEKAGLLDPAKHARLALIPDRELLELPFAALVDGGGRRLAERMPLSAAVSLEVLTWPETETKATGSLFCIADPTGDGKSEASIFLAGPSALPGAREEGREVAALFPGSVTLVGKQATEVEVQRRLTGFSVLHFATHGYLDPENGLRSGLVLAPSADPDEVLALLDAGEIADMQLAARLAVLSACESGQGERSGGEGLLGLTWGFAAAGCPSVVASQWSVDDAATRKLMVTFYQALKAGKRKDDAMRDAMLAVKATPNLGRPVYWAAFQVCGDATPLRL